MNTQRKKVMYLSIIPDWITALAALIAIVVGSCQLYWTRAELQKTAEDALSKEYRAIIAQLPVNAMLSDGLTPAEIDQYLNIFYQYFDLSNQQLYLIEKKRINKKMAIEWKEGMEQNLRRASFTGAWNSLRPRLDGSFDELKLFIEKGRLNEHSTVA